MPFGLGFFATAGAGGAAGSFDLLETQVLGSSAASVTFSSLSSYASTYQHLQIRMTTRSTADSATTFLRFNADTGSNYSAHRLFGQGSSVVSDAFANQAYLFAGANMESGATANSFAGSVVDILDAFETTKYKTTRTMAGATSTPNYVVMQSGSWRNTAALTQILLYPNTGSYVTGSRFSLYGIKVN
jgi:hypothetical protein